MGKLPMITVTLTLPKVGLVGTTFRLRLSMV
jgi:hypothetical protein